MQDVKISKITHSTKPIRSDMGVLDSLTESIREHGLIEPIVVRAKEDEFEVVAGNRRFEACKSLGWKTVACRIVELTEKEAFEVSLVENLQRDALNPIEEAKAFKSYVKDYGYGGVSELARKIGKSQEHVSKRLQLLRLPREVQQQIIRRRITPSTAYELCCLDTQHVENLLEEVLQRKMSLRDVRKVVRNYQETSNQEMDSSQLFSSHSVVEEQLARQGVRRLQQSIISLKTCMAEFDQIINGMDNHWILKEILIQERRFLHDRIDVLLRLRSKVSRNELEAPISA
jgi:ParB family transcriptional regulator, chromosome partitioning protein